LNVAAARRAWSSAFQISAKAFFAPELAAAMPARVRSLTILNTMVEVNHFRRPWVMQPFAWPVVGELWLAAVNRPLFVAVDALAGRGRPVGARGRAGRLPASAQTRGRRAGVPEDHARGWS
jgi:hypothetical protein